MKIDPLDRWSGWAIILLAVWTGALIWQQAGQSGPGEAAAVGARASVVYVDPELDRNIEVARNLLAAGRPDESETLINGLLERFPYEGRLHMLLGDIRMHRQDPLAALLAFRRAIDLNPDFLDKRTPLFQGKKIKVSLKEATAALEELARRTPEATELGDYRQTLHYMKRRIAGSCG